MFDRYGPNDLVKRGTYLSLKGGDFVTIGERLGRLPDSSGKYIRISPLAALLIGPLAGLTFIIFLPFAVPAVILWALAGRAKAALPALASRYTTKAGEGPLAARVVSADLRWTDGHDLGNALDEPSDDKGR